MLARNESKLNMFRVVEKSCDDNATIVALRPAFASSVVIFKSNIAEILSAVQKEKQVTSGITIEKVQAKKTLCRAAMEVAAPVFAMASATNNEVLKQQANFAYSDLFKIKDDECAPVIQNIHDLGVANILDLSNYGINALVLSELQTHIDIYQAVVPSPRNAASIKKTARTNIKRLVKETDILLKEQMDKTVIGFKTSNPDFLLTYTSNRIIIDPKKTSAKLKGKIKSAVNGKIIKGAVITLHNTAFTATTNEFGKYEIKGIPFGLYTATVNAPNYSEIIDIDVHIKLGKICTIDLVLTPIEIDNPI